MVGGCVCPANIDSVVRADRGVVRVGLVGVVRGGREGFLGVVRGGRGGFVGDVKEGVATEGSSVDGDANDMR